MGVFFLANNYSFLLDFSNWFLFRFNLLYSFGREMVADARANAVIRAREMQAFVRGALAQRR